MYGMLHLLLNPRGAVIEGRQFKAFGIPREYGELRRQLEPLSLDYDKEGRLVLPPKNKPSAESTVVCLQELLGCSPDEADSTVLAVFGMLKRAPQRIAGAVA
jgi:hypothetical protein